MSEIKKVVLAYSGGLDTSVILKWLQETYRCVMAGTMGPASWRRTVASSLASLTRRTAMMQR